MSFDYIFIDKASSFVIKIIQQATLATEAVSRSFPILAGSQTVAFVIIICIIVLFLKIPVLRGIAVIPYRGARGALRMIGIAGSPRRWSVVYDSKTKLPIDPAYVTVRDMVGRTVASAITDLDGRFGFILNRGIYQIDVQKTNYVFPSTALQGMKSDGAYSGLYFGERIEVMDRGQSLALSIPMDPVNADWNQEEKERRDIFLRPDRVREYEHAAASYFVLGVLLTVGRIFYYRDETAFTLAAGYAAMLVIGGLRYLFTPEEYYHSAVVERKTKQPLAFARVKIFTAKNHFEISQKITSFEGQFVCLVPRGRYYVTIEKRDAQGNYSKVFTSRPFRAAKGYIGKYFKV